MPTVLTFHDQRFGDTYTLHLLDGEFQYALRYAGRVGGEPIVYEEWEDLPISVQNDLQDLIDSCPPSSRNEE